MPRDRRVSLFLVGELWQQYELTTPQVQRMADWWRAHLGESVVVESLLGWQLGVSI